MRKESTGSLERRKHTKTEKLSRKLLKTAPNMREQHVRQDEYYSLIFAPTLTKRWWSSSYWHAISSVGGFFVNIIVRLKEKEDFITVLNDRRGAFTSFWDCEQTNLQISVRLLILKHSTNHFYTRKRLLVCCNSE